MEQDGDNSVCTRALALDEEVVSVDCDILTYFSLSHPLKLSCPGLRHTSER
jgi:hypothetical protein